MRAHDLISCSLLLGLAACSSLSDEDTIRLTTFKQNSKQLYDNEQFRRAEDQCRKGLLIDPEDMSLNQVLAYSLLRQGSAANLHEAELVFRECLELEPDDMRNQLGLAEVQYQLANTYQDQAPRLAVDERLPPEERAKKVAAAQQRAKELFGECEALLTSITGSNRGRDNSWALNTLSRLYAIQGRYAESTEVLRRWIGMLGNSINLRRSQVDVERLSPESRELFDAELARLTRQHHEGLHLLANVAAKRAAWDEVIDAYALLEAADALEPADYFNRAGAYDQLGSRDAAIKDYDTFKSLAAARGAAFSENVHRAMSRVGELRAGLPTRLEEANAGT